MRRFVLILLGLLLFALPAQARMYKWVDKNGTIHFTNTIPPHDAKSVYPSEETAGDPREREMRPKPERENEEAGRGQNPQNREDVGTPPGGMGGPYSITIYDIQHFDSMDNDWSVKKTGPGYRGRAPADKYRIRSPEEMEPADKYRIRDPEEIEPGERVPGGQFYQPMEIQPEMQWNPNQFGGAG